MLGKFNNVSLQLLHDCGLNPFAVQLLAESYADHPDPKPVKFKYETMKNGKPIAVFVRLDPQDPIAEMDQSGNLTSLALALDSISANGCDCGEDEPGTCLACLCEKALRDLCKRLEGNNAI